MEFIEGCPICERLSAEYESATMEWFRVEGHLRIAEYSSDGESTHRITEELGRVSKRRTAVKDAIADHKRQAHAPRVRGAGSGCNNEQN